MLKYIFTEHTLNPKHILKNAEKAQDVVVAHV